VPYCTTGDVKALISTRWRKTFEDLPLADENDSEGDTIPGVSSLISRAQGFVDDFLRPVCYPFNETTGSPSTPDIIRRAATYIAASWAYDQIRMSADAEDLATSAAYNLKQGVALLQEVEDQRGETGLERVTSETLTFGSGTDWDLSLTEAVVGASLLTSEDPPSIKRSTLRLATVAGDIVAGNTFTAAQYGRMRLGVDYRLDWSAERRIWIFRAIHSHLTPPTFLNAVKVKYAWNYRRIQGDADVNTRSLLVG